MLERNRAMIKIWPKSVRNCPAKHCCLLMDAVHPSWCNSILRHSRHGFAAQMSACDLVESLLNGLWVSRLWGTTDSREQCSHTQSY